MALLWGSISQQPLQPERLRSMLEDSSCGAVCLFEGRVRDRQEEKAVLELEYEGYRPMAERALFQLLDEASRRFALQAAVAAHRLGRLRVSELAVWIGVAALHRSEAFSGCRWLIDEVKRRLPIWKRETYEGGESAWIAGCSLESGHARAH